MLIRIFSLWLAVIPLVVWRFGYEGPKIFYFFVGSILLSIYWIRKLMVDWKSVSFTAADYFFFLWLLVLIVSSAVGVHPVDSILGGSYRHQGVIFFVGLWLTGKTISILKAADKKFLGKTVSIVVLIECIIVGAQLISGATYFGKPLGTLGEANAVAGYLAIGTFFVVENFPKLLVIFPLAVIAFEQSRSGLLAFAPIILRFWKKLAPLFVILVVGVVLAISLQKTGDFFENREMIWKVGVSQVLRRPMLGFGAESGEVVFAAAYKKLGFPLEGMIIDRSHNLLLDVAMWSGIVGLIVFSLWLYFSYSNISNTPMKLAFLSVIIYSMLQPLSIAHWALLVTILNVGKNLERVGMRKR